MTAAKLFFLSLIILALTGCASRVNTATNSTSTALIRNLQNVEYGTVVELRHVSSNNTNLSDIANIGISVGSGGHRGVFGALNAGKVMDALTQPRLLEIMIKKTNGEYVTVTQPSGSFKVGDYVKIFIRNGRAIVQH